MMAHVLNERALRYEIRKLVRQTLREAEEQGEPLDAELAKVGKEIAAAIKAADIDVSEIEEQYNRAIKEGASKQQLNEIVVSAIISVISTLMTINALIGIIFKGVKFLSKKLNFQQGQDFADGMLGVVHEVEDKFKAPINFVLKPIIRNKETRESVVNILYAIIVACMAADYGADAVESLKNAEWFEGGFKGLKLLAKSEEVIANINNPLIKQAILAFK
jgi:hypothetical protein